MTLWPPRRRAPRRLQPTPRSTRPGPRRAPRVRLHRRVINTEASSLSAPFRWCDAMVRPRPRRAPPCRARERSPSRRRAPRTHSCTWSAQIVRLGSDGDQERIARRTCIAQACPKTSASAETCSPTLISRTHASSSSSLSSSCCSCSSTSASVANVSFATVGATPVTPGREWHCHSER